MSIWKLLVAADLLILAGYWLAVWKRHERVRRSGFLTIPVGLIGTVGLIIYAFSIPVISPAFWRFFLPAFAASGAWEISSAVNTDDFNIGTLIGAGVALALLGFISIALYRLGGSHWIGVAGL